MTRGAVLRDPTLAAGVGQVAAIQTVCPNGLALSVIGTQHDADTIEQAVAAFARDPNGGLIVTASPLDQVANMIYSMGHSSQTARSLSLPLLQWPALLWP